MADTRTPEQRRYIMSKYRLRLVPAMRIKPREDMVKIAVPDSTPELIRAYALDDEQTLLAIVRYNRLIDTFLRLTAYSLQNHLAVRPTIADPERNVQTSSG